MGPRGLSIGLWRGLSFSAKRCEAKACACRYAFFRGHAGASGEPDSLTDVASRDARSRAETQEATYSGGAFQTVAGPAIRNCIRCSLESHVVGECGLEALVAGAATVPFGLQWTSVSGPQTDISAPLSAQVRVEVRAQHFGSTFWSRLRSPVCMSAMVFDKIPYQYSVG